MRSAGTPPTIALRLLPNLTLEPFMNIFLQPPTRIFSRKIPVVPFLAFAFIASRSFAAPTGAADLAALTKGVREINTQGTVGGVSVFGPNAFAVVAGKDGGTAMLPLVAATRWEKGRVVAFGHDGFLKSVNENGNGELLANAARWVSGDAAKPKIGVVNAAALLGHLQAGGFESVALNDKQWATKLDGLDAVCVNALSFTANDVAPLEKFVRAGGGLITGVTGWGWMQIFRRDKAGLATEFPGNVLLRNAGIQFSASTPDRTLPDSFATGGDLTLLNATAALEALIDHASGKTALASGPLTQCTATIADAVRSLPPGDDILLPKIAALAKQPTEFPSASKPLRSTDALARLMLTCELETLRAASPENLHAHPASFSFPGIVPGSAPRIAERTLTIDAGVPQWHSTGLYAAPGEIIHITLPPEAVGKGFGVRIGCHTDSLWHLEEWKRAPEISRRQSLESVQTAAANPFGGLVYIDVPDNSALRSINVIISGAVEAPHFVLGQTSLDDWQNRIRNHPAPWAELETGKIILSIPSDYIRMLDDPAALMALWDRILDAEADLAAIPRERKRPERIVPDVQISAGYMHSGYPVMTWLDRSVDQALSVMDLAAGSWGHFHEFGHNHQRPEWTFDGTVEVTCNLFSLYVIETVCGKPPGDVHVAMKPATVDLRLRSHLGSADKFPRWKKDPFLALTMYDQLRAGFGWETYKKVFAEYRLLPQAERPKDDEEKRDQWLVRFSRAAGRNLGPFFEAWGVPTSAAARQSIAALPAWMPADWPNLTGVGSK